VRLHRFGSARAALAHMPEAPIPAAKQALDAAGTSIKRNDVLFSQQTGFLLVKMNNFGCSLILGHPQAPMGTRGGDRADRGIGTAGRRLRLVQRLRRSSMTRSTNTAAAYAATQCN